MDNNRLSGTGVSETRSSKKRSIAIIIILGIGVLSLLAGAAYAARQSIQLNSSASFPVDI
jgi:hypothetical protein